VTPSALLCRITSGDIVCKTGFRGRVFRLGGVLIPEFPPAASLSVRGLSRGTRVRGIGGFLVFHLFLVFFFERFVGVTDFRCGWHKTLPPYCQSPVEGTLLPSGTADSKQNDAKSRDFGTVKRPNLSRLEGSG
jgi:hypothetical protein